jgi:hypothetical protein
MNKTIDSSELRWSNYFVRRGNEFYVFWREYLQNNKRNLLFILGQGFDPRMCFGFEALLEAGGSGRRDCVVIEFDEGSNSPSAKHSNLLAQNKVKLDQLIINRDAKIIKKPVPMWSDDGRRIGSSSATHVFTGLSEFSNYTDIIIDISALPRGIYFSLIGKILYLLDSIAGEGASVPNFFVIVSENAELDRRIKDEGIDDVAYYVHGFAGDLETEATLNLPKIWIPILGEGQGGQLERIYNLVIPDEICPVFPSPSVDPRRGDKLLIEYREYLFDQLLVEPRNIIYAAEQNPFDVYRQIHRTVQHYNKALKPLGGCKVAISALSSKLLSIGALLSAYELKNVEGLSAGIANIEAQGYQIEGETESIKAELFTLWLAGDCYEH